MKKIKTGFSLIMLLISSFACLNVISHAETDTGLERPIVEPPEEITEIAPSSVDQEKTSLKTEKAINITVSDVIEMAARITDYYDKHGIIWSNTTQLYSHAILILMIQHQLLQSGFEGDTKIGWEKGAKIKQTFNIKEGHIDIDNFNIESTPAVNYEYIPEIKSPEGIKYQLFSVKVWNMGMNSLMLASDQKKYFELLPTPDTIKFYSLDGTVEYRMDITPSHVELIVERVQAKSSTDLSVPLEMQDPVKLRLNKSFIIGFINVYDELTISDVGLSTFEYPADTEKFISGISPITTPHIKIHAKENNALNLNEDVDELDLSKFVSVSNTMKETVGDESQITYEWASKPDITKPGISTGVIKATEKYGEYVNTDTTEVSFTVVNDQLTGTATPQTVPLGTNIDSLDLNKFVKDVKLGDTSLTSDQYTTELTGGLSTDEVGKETAKVKVSLKSDPTNKVEIDVPVTIEWGNSLVFKDDFNNGFNYTAASISLLNGTEGPKLVATKGDGFREAGEPLFYARPDITIYSKSLDTIVRQFSETTYSQHPNDVMTRWNGLFKEMGDQLKYGDILGVKVYQSYNPTTNQNGKNTWVSREDKLVTETEGLDTAFYELTKEGLKLIDLSGSANKQTVQYGTDSTKIDFTSYVKDVKIGNTIVPKDYYNVKLIGEFDTTHLGETTIKVELSLKKDPTHKIQVDVPVTVKGEMSATAAPQTVPLGTNIDSLDLNKFVKDVKLGDTSLTSDQYTTELTGGLSTDEVGKETAKVKVSLKSDPTNKVEIDVPVTIEWGNSLRIKGTSFQTLTGLSLTESKGSYTVTSTRGTDEDFVSEKINSKFTGEYLNVSFYKQVSGRLPKPTEFSFKGTDQISTVPQLIGKQEVDLGDIVEIKHAEIADYSRMISLYQNGQESMPYQDNKLNSSSSYYEITDTGYNVLFFNQLKARSGIVSIYTTKEYFDQHVTDFLDTEEYSTVTVKGFSEYPDTTSSGRKEGKIKVAETLSNGQEVEYEYTVPITVTEGSLTISVPGTLEYEDIRLSSKEQIGQRKIEKPAGFQVTDSRGSGKQGGWYITAKSEATEDASIGNYLIYRQNDGTSQKLLDNIKIYQQERQVVSEKPLTIDITSWWSTDTGILLKLPKGNSLRPNMDYQATIVFTIVEAP